MSRLLGVVPKGTDSADALAIAIAGMNDEAGMMASSVENSAPQGSGLAAAIEKALAKESSR